MKVWVKYTPVKVTDGGSQIAKGEMDQGIIYVALVDESTTEYETEQWPAIIKTDPKKLSLFNPDGANMIAYGEKVFTEATEGSGLIQIEIPINYKRTGVTPSNIIVVASASRYGDYFQGGSGSVMYIDDIELTY